MKKQITLLALALTTLLAQTAWANEKLTVAATPVPAAEILEFMKPALAKKGIDLDVRVFTDYIQPDQQVADGAIDMNCYQHKPFLQAFNQQRGTHLVEVGNVYLPPLAAYSHVVKNLKDLPDHATVAIPNDTSNGARALLLLEKAGLIQLKDPSDPLASTNDIVKNPKHLEFKELEAAMLPRMVDEVDLAVINANYALEVGLNPMADSLIHEDKNSPYANLCATRPENKGKPAIEALMQAWHSPETVKFIQDKYKGTVIPVPR